MGATRLLRPVVRAVAAVGLVAGGWLSVAPVGAAPASSVDDLGWWSRVNQEPTLGAALVFPDVTPGQLLVEASPEGATAIAAVRATLPEGTGNPVLTLQTASAVGAESAVLLACQSGSGWTGAHAGAWDAKPSPDCTQSIQGIPSEDGTAFSFALAALQFGDQLDIVLTPGTVGDSGATSAFRVVFERPGAADIEVSEAAAPAPAVPTVSMPASQPPAPSSFGGAPSAPSFSAPAGPSSGTVMPAPPVRAALPEVEQGATATAPVVQAARPLAPPTLAATGGNDGRLLGVIVVLGALALLYWSSQQQVPDRLVLSRFAASAPASTVAAEPQPKTLGGLGRFRRERTGAARRLGG